MNHAANIEFSLFFRENCHLCKSMKFALTKLQKKISFSWVEIDIDKDTDLIYLYDSMVPVLQFEGREVCHYFIDEDAIRKILS